MMKMVKGLCAALCLLGFFSAAYAIHEIIPSESQPTLPDANAEKLNEYLVKFNPYTSWDLWPGKGRLYKGTEPHGVLLTTFVNESAYFSITRKQPMTDGAIIAKENYTADRKFIALTVMYKIKGYNPEAGDWFWVKFAPDGSVQNSGKVKDCIQCHSSKKHNDFIFSGMVGK
jgi:hypothetical protein